jgi:hypothetical protein
MLAAPASQKLYPYHDSPSRLCIYAAYGSPRLSGIRGAARYTPRRMRRDVQPAVLHEHTHGPGRSACERALPRRTLDCVEN